MKKVACFILFFAFAQLLFLPNLYAQQKEKLKFPYKKEGLTERQAIIHLLNRFTYGFNQQDIDYIESIGLENWFAAQLEGISESSEEQARLKQFDDISKSNQELFEIYPKNFRVRREAVQAGVVNKDSLGTSRAHQELLKEYMSSKGYKYENELIRQFLSSKLIRAAYSENQLREVMTDFWFNHFNVSFSKGQSSTFIPNYEAAVIRPNALGNFEELLVATAQSPAMLLYLDNATSVGTKKNGNRGLNENYARELLELHTLGVDAGYTQQDVTEAARVLTGWTYYPMGKISEERIAALSKNRKNIHQGDFLFQANNHDSGDKEVLGVSFKNEGYNEGLKLMKLLSTNPKTALFISKKLAVRFVADTPSAAIMERMQQAFIKSNGEIKNVLVAMVNSRDFWSKDVLYTKIKTPFELAISSVRALDATIENPVKLNNWITRMGEKKYYYIAPTGFPDYSSYWINTGSLLNRMNFGLSFANQNSSGVAIDLLEVLDFKEPESPQDALEAYSEYLLPEANYELLDKRLSPLLTEQNLQAKINQKVDKKTDENSEEVRRTAVKNSVNNKVLAQVVGLLIGSPEFQRR
ncbi:DUF1800 domain-containing protein [Sphingobacterium hungaricum]|uniref:DUF1800 domain-containing protein n=1 Tax=Sphingobacterium hungaricum TaxID=2082723 RepID=A0A928YRS9_9SPHI|nr:DUF1800 domain-containing protein [Sphingobacterium hungaricum]MBE8713608.1 DUF1800 domain-containing protein [Sphingobacterium hungaricum]